MLCSIHSVYSIKVMVCVDIRCCQLQSTFKFRFEDLDVCSGAQKYLFQEMYCYHTEDGQDMDIMLPVTVGLDSNWVEFTSSGHLSLAFIRPVCSHEKV